PQPGGAFCRSPAIGGRPGPGASGGPRVATSLQPKSNRQGTERRTRVFVQASRVLEESPRQEGRETSKGGEGQDCSEACAGAAGTHEPLSGVIERERASLRGLGRVEAEVSNSPEHVCMVEKSEPHYLGCYQRRVMS